MKKIFIIMLLVFIPSVGFAYELPIHNFRLEQNRSEIESQLTFVKNFPEQVSTSDKDKIFTYSSESYARLKWKPHVAFGEDKLFFISLSKQNNKGDFEKIFKTLHRDDYFLASHIFGSKNSDVLQQILPPFKNRDTSFELLKDIMLNESFEVIKNQFESNEVSTMFFLSDTVVKKYYDNIKTVADVKHTTEVINSSGLGTILISLSKRNDDYFLFFGHIDTFLAISIDHSNLLEIDAVFSSEIDKVLNDFLYNK